MAKVKTIEDIAPEATDSTLVLQELKKMQAQLTDLKKENEEMKKSARIGSSTDQLSYEGPRLFSVKTWNDKIVCDYSSRKKEANKDFIYKNQYGVYVDNQVMSIFFEDGESEDVLYSQFSMGLQKSERIHENGWIKNNAPGVPPTISSNSIRKIAADGKNSEFLIFDIDGRKIEVNIKCVN